MAKNNKQKKNYALRIILFLIIVSICAVSFVWQTQIETMINNYLNPEISSDVDSCELKIHFIDVGQGDSIVIELPDDKIMLIDAGPGKSEESLLNYLENAIFATRSDRVVDYFIVTHQDEDHIGGADKIFDNFNIINFYRPKVYTYSEQEQSGLVLDDDSLCDTLVFRTMIEKMENENCENIVEHAVCENLPYLDENCGYTIEFLSPIDEIYSDPNDYSPIMILTYQNRKFMLTGDAEEKVEKQVIEKYLKSKLDVDVLKLGHHGSSTSTSQDFFDAVSPEYAVICVGEGNKYDHPTDSVIKRVASKIGEHNIYRTDKDSNIIFGVDKDDLVGEKGAIKIAFNGEVHTAVYIQWWYVVVIIVGISFVIIILPKKSQKKLRKKLK